MIDKIRKYFKTIKELENDLKIVTEELRVVSKERDKLNDALDKDLQAKKIERLTDNAENYKKQRNALRTENTNLRIELVEARAKLRGAENERSKAI